METKEQPNEPLDSDYASGASGLSHCPGNALYWAVVNGDLNVFMSLLGKAGIDPSFKTCYGETLLHTAALWGQAHFIRPLLTECRLQPELKDSRGKTPMQRVSENGDIKCLKAFLACGIIIEPDTLTLAALNGRLEFVRFCIDELRMHIDTRDEFKRTALLRSVEGGHYKVVLYLLYAGADITNISSTKRNVLHFAAESGNSHLVNKLIEHLKIYPNILKLIGRLDEFLNAKDHHSNPEYIYRILGRDKGRNAWHDVHVKRHLNPSGNTDVHWTVERIKSGWGANPEQEHSDMICGFFRKKRHDQIAANDKTPLHTAIFKGHEHIVQLFIENGANIASCDFEGNTPLMLADSRNLLSTVRLLKAKEKRLQDASKSGQDQLAEMSGYTDQINCFTENDYSMQIKAFLDNDVAAIVEHFSEGNLRYLQETEGKRKYMVDRLYDLSNGVNQVLIGIGSGPILEDTN